MRVIPVLDIKSGIVVRGIGGRREEYRPLASRLCGSPQPVDVARAIRQHLGLQEFYLADLDAIGGSAPASAIYADIHSLGCSLWVDAGIRDLDDARALAAAGLEGIIAGLETLLAPDDLESIVQEFVGGVVFSLDLKAGLPLGEKRTWGTDPAAIAARAVAAGVRRLIVLDLARVGGSGGTGTEDLCSELAIKYPHVEIVAGGGVQNVSDLLRLKQIGVRAALVASALHDGRLGREDLGVVCD